MIEAFKDFGLRMPTFESIENGFLVIVRNNKETTQEIILRLLKKNPNYTRGDLVRLTGKSDSAIKEHLSKLKKSGLPH